MSDIILHMTILSLAHTQMYVYIILIPLQVIISPIHLPVVSATYLPYSFHNGHWIYHVQFS